MPDLTRIHPVPRLSAIVLAAMLLAFGLLGDRPLAAKLAEDAEQDAPPQALTAYAWTSPLSGYKNIQNVYVTNWAGPERVATQLLAVPKGKRTLLLIGFEDDLVFANNNKYKSRTRLTGHPLDKTRDAQGNVTGYASPWLDHGTTDLQARVERWMADFVAAGGDVDHVAFDFEGGLQTWGMSAAQMRAIIADPRSAGLEAEMAPWHLADAMWSEPARMRFNALMARKVAAAMRRAEFDVVRRHFPAVTGSSYGHTLMSEDDVQPDLNGHPQYGYEIVGTHNTWAFYGWMNQLKNWIKPGLTQAYGSHPFAVLRWHIKTFRAMRRSAPAVPIRPWIGYKSWTSDSVGPIWIGNTPYYDELVFHLAVNGADDFLYFAPAPPYGKATSGDHFHLDSLLEELRVRGVWKVGIAITNEDIPWNSDVVASGMQIDGNTVLWRISAPDTEPVVNVVQNGLVKEQLRIPQGNAGVWYTTRPGEPVRFALPSTDIKNRPPSVELWAPATSSPNENVTPIPYAVASDLDGSVSSVGFFYSNEWSGAVDLETPYQLYHTLHTAGPYKLIAVAKDNKGATTISPPRTVTIVGSEPTVSTRESTAVAVTSLTVAGRIERVNGTVAITRGFEYGTTAAYGERVATDGLYGSSDYSLAIMGLLCGTLYHFRAFAVNSLGTGYGADSTAQTLPCGTSPATTTTLPESLNSALVGSATTGRFR